MKKRSLKKRPIVLLGIFFVVIESIALALWHHYDEPGQSFPGRSEAHFPRIFPTSPLNDKTLPWDLDMDRPWLRVDEIGAAAPKPPGMLLLTEFGWNHPNQTMGQRLYGGVRARELIEAVVNHPWFHPTAWRDINEGRMPISNTTHYYLFLDQDVCMEKNYPFYNEGIKGRNRDRGDINFQMYHIHRVPQILSSKLFTNSSFARYVEFECSGGGPKSSFTNARMESGNASQWVWATLSSDETQAAPQDFGLPPPVLKKCDLTKEQRNEIYTCEAEEKRSVLLSFVGNIFRKHCRRLLVKLNNDKDVIVKRGIAEPPQTLALASIFGAAPRGDNLFTYRFTEQLSCGTIPVIYADGWVLPFRLDWSEAAVIIPERNASLSVVILKAIPKEQRCRMRQRGLEIYEKYMKDAKGTIQGVVDRLELQVKAGM
jgi:hypothetical protein